MSLTIQEVDTSTTGTSEDSFSDSSFLDIDLDEIEDGEIDITESIELQVIQDLDEVSSLMIPKCTTRSYLYRLMLKPPSTPFLKRIFVPLSQECTASST